MPFSLNSNEMSSYQSFSKLALPRHTSYPAVPYWKDKFNQYEVNQLGKSYTQGREDLSLYFHVPFCQQLCFYCGCSKEIRQRNSPKTREKIDSLLQGFQQELQQKQKLLADTKVKHLHFGGGTPTFLNPDEWEQLWGYLHRSIRIADNAEIAVEIDPRTISYDTLKFLKELGFNRISLGVQDFDLRVQQAINRVQPYYLVENAVNWARDLGFNSINFDLIYGLPFQSKKSVEETIHKVIGLNPDRIAYYRLAIIPDLFKWQRSFLAKDLPAGLEPLKLNLTAMELFDAAGYRFIGLDHFAKESDELCKAFSDNTLHRNFQGMTAGKDQYIIGIGPSSISDLGGLYFQNPRSLNEWRESLSTSEYRYKGHMLSFDDKLRRELIQGIYSYGNIDLQFLEDKFAISFNQYFAKEKSYIEHLISSGLISRNSYIIYENQLLGRLLRRVFASAFDNYLPADRFIVGTPGQASHVG